MDENFNPNPTPTPGPAIPSVPPAPENPPAPVAQDEPLGTPTPPPDAPASPASGAASPSSPTISKPSPSGETPSVSEDQPGAKVGAEDVEEESPIIPTQPKKPKTGLIAGVSAALLLLISIPLGIILIQNQQEVRERASAGTCRDNPSGAPDGYKWEANCGGPVCQNNSDCPKGANNQDGWCYGFEDGFKCLKLVQLTGVSTPRATCNNTAGQYCTADQCSENGDVAGSGTCPATAPNCCREAPPSGGQPTSCVDTPCTVQATDGQSLDDDANKGAKPAFCAANDQDAAKACQAWVDQHNREIAGSGGTGGTPGGGATTQSCVDTPCTVKATDDQSLDDPQNRGQKDDFCGTNQQNAAQACQAWVNEHNTAIKSILVYSHPDGQEIKNPGKDTVRAGDVVKFCVKRANSTRYSQLKIVINGSVSKYANATTLNSDNIGDLFCVKYDIPAQATSLRLTGEWQQ